MTSDKFALPRRLLVYCDSLARRQRLLETHSATLVRLRDAGYLVQLPQGWKPETTADSTSGVASGNVTAFAVHSFFVELERYRHQQQPGAAWVGHTLVHAPLLESTQDLIRSFAFPDGTVVVADRQVSGRGRRGATWDSPGGSLAFSLQLELQNGCDRPVQFIQYIAGLALAESIPNESPEAEQEAARALHIKWPNDLLVDGLKVAGILCESSVFRDRFTVYVGIGVNVANAAPTAALAQFSWASALTRERLLARFLVRFERFLTIFLDKGWVASGLGARYTARWLHQRQLVLLAETNQRGRIIGLSQQGCLLVELDPLSGERGRSGASAIAGQAQYEAGTCSQYIEVEPDVSSFDWQRGIVQRKQ
jgi:biotin--protein ligase